MSIFQQMKDTLSRLCASLVGGFAHYVLLALLVHCFLWRTFQLKVLFKTSVAIAACMDGFIATSKQTLRLNREVQ